MAKQSLSVKKRIRQAIKARQRNKAIRSAMRTAIKRVRLAGNREEAEEAFARAVSVIDRTAQKGVIHKNTAARYKSRLARLIRSM